MSSLGLEPG